MNLLVAVAFLKKTAILETDPAASVGSCSDRVNAAGKRVAEL